MNRSRRQKSRLRERKEKTRQWEERVGLASRWLTKLRCYAKQNPRRRRVVLYVRVSDRKQAIARSELAQRERLLRAARKYGLEVVAVIIDVRRAKRHSKRGSLLRAFAIAKERDAFVLAYATNRFIRSDKHNSVKRPDAVPTEDEFEELAALADGVPMVTVLHPDLPEAEVRGYVTRLGQAFRGSFGGRPKKQEPKPKRKQASNTKARREYYIHRIREMHRGGLSLRQIESVVGVWETPFDPPPYRTIADWLKEPKKRCASFSRDKQ